MVEMIPPAETIRTLWSYQYVCWCRRWYAVCALACSRHQRCRGSPGQMCVNVRKPQTHQAGILSDSEPVSTGCVIKVPRLVRFSTCPNGTNRMLGLFFLNEANSSEVVSSVAYTTGFAVEASRISASFFSRSASL